MFFFFWSLKKINVWERKKTKDTSRWIGFGPILNDNRSGCQKTENVFLGLVLPDPTHPTDLISHFPSKYQNPPQRPQSQRNPSAWKNESKMASTSASRSGGAAGRIKSAATTLFSDNQSLLAVSSAHLFFEPYPCLKLVVWIWCSPLFQEIRKVVTMMKDVGVDLERENESQMVLTDKP